MALYTLSRKVRMDILNQEGDITELLFNNQRAQHACRLLLDELKAKNGLTRQEFSKFAQTLNHGDFKYSRRQFYATVRHVLLTLGLIGIQQRAIDCSKGEDLSPVRSKCRSIVDKYVPIRQPIPKRPPDGLSLVRLVWIICEKWNREFFEEEFKTNSE
jgi:hypothetical protein